MYTILFNVWIFLQIMVRILALLLKKKMEKRAVTTDFYYTFVRKTEEEMRDLSVILIKEKENDEKVNNYFSL